MDGQLSISSENEVPAVLSAWRVSFAASRELLVIVNSLNRVIGV